MVRRDLEQRYKGAIFGWFWPLFIQISQLLVFTYLFAAIFRVRLAIPSMPNNTVAYGLWLFSGLVGWTAFQSGVLNGAMSVVSSANLVKRLVFPLALLPLVPPLSALVEEAGGLLALVCLVFLTTGHLALTICLLPAIIAIQFLITAGLAYYVSALTTYIRDVPQVLGPLFLLFFYLTPIVYPSSAVPHAVSAIVLLNPMSTIVDAYRALILSGVVPPARPLLVTALIAIVVFVSGLQFFRRVRSSFIDVL